MNLTPKEAIERKYPNKRLVDLSLIIFGNENGFSIISKFVNGTSASFSSKRGSKWQIFCEHFKNYGITIIIPNRVDYEVHFQIKKRDKIIKELEREIEDLKLQIQFMEELPNNLKNVKRFAKALVGSLERFESVGKL